MISVPYEVIDVFTTTRFGGNPLAVILDGRELSDHLMQQIAAEFGYSETTFVLPPSDPQHTARVRIFTPTTEVPFAGHPNVGTAFVLARHGTVCGNPVGTQMVFEEAAGLVEVTIVRSQDSVTGAAITAPQALTIGTIVPPEVVAACASLSPDMVSVTTHPPLMLSVGLPFVIAELTSETALAQAKPSIADFTAAEATLPKGDLFALFLYVATPDGPHDFSARMFAPLDNVLEDPATGSACAALGAYRVTLMPERDATVALSIAQGVTMGRPSVLSLQVTKSAGNIQRVVVQGDCVPVMRGELFYSR